MIYFDVYFFRRTQSSISNDFEILHNSLCKDFIVEFIDKEVYCHSLVFVSTVLDNSWIVIIVCIAFFS